MTSRPQVAYGHGTLKARVSIGVPEKRSPSERSNSPSHVIHTHTHKQGVEHSPAKLESTMSGNLRCVIVAVDGSEESMNALTWALDNLKLRSPVDDYTPGGSFVVLHVQSPPSIAAGLNPGSIPFGGPS
jgi:hypothetical protein